MIRNLREELLDDYELLISDQSKIIKRNNAEEKKRNEDFQYRRAIEICPICKEYYNLNDRRINALRCGHVICSTCVRKEREQRNF